MKKYRVCVIGLGYIGLPTAALLAQNGCEVIGVDVKEESVATINAGRIPIVEPGLDQVVADVVSSGRLKAAMKPCEADVFIIAVPTPVNSNPDGSLEPGLEYVIAASKSIAPYVRPGNLVVLESTSPVGTTEKVGEVLAENGVDVSSVYLAHCPERVLPGRVMIELVENSRIVGGTTPEATEKTCEFYKCFVKGEILKTNSRTAEMTKLVENSFRDVNIAFANELSMICDELNINTLELINLANHHPRVNILNPGCGVGGHCIAVDPWFIVCRSPERARLIRQAREVNDYKALWVTEKIKAEYRKLSGRKPVVAVLGLAFKPNIDDLRNSPAVYIAGLLKKEEDAEFLFVEPNIKTHKEFPLTDAATAISRADVLVCLVAHKEFAGLPGRKPDAAVLNFCNLPGLE